MTNSMIFEKLTSVSLIFVALFILICCKKTVPTGDIEGVVLFAGTTVPVAGVNIDIKERKALTSEDGTYRITGIPAGKYSLKAERVGFITHTIEVTVNEGTTFVVIPMVSPVFSTLVEGRITGDFTENPQQGLIVVMLNPDGTESEIIGTSDGNGYFQLQYVPFGERSIVVKSSNVVVYRFDFLLSGPDYQLDIAIPEPMVFTDSRDGKTYKAMKIGNQTWLMENLAYLPVVCPPDWESDRQELYYVYDYLGTDLNQAKANVNYSTYGVLYNWVASMTACPVGWHLPSDSEWKTIEIYLGMDPEDADQPKWRLTGAVGMKLKSDIGWDSDGNGSNSSGFGALPGGSRMQDGSFNGLGLHCNFWTSSLNSISMPWNRFVSFNNDGVSRNGLMTTLGFSVRCIKDEPEE